MDFALALGVFLGNWLLIPLVSKRSFKEGFWIGVIAAGIVLLLCLLWPLSVAI